MPELDLSDRVTRALGAKEFRILALEEQVAQRDARIAELEAQIVATEARDAASVGEVRERPIRLDRRRKPGDDENEEPPGA